MSRNARMTPDERYQRRIQDLMRCGDLKPAAPVKPAPKAQPAQRVDTARVVAEAKANAVTLFEAASKAADAEPWVPGAVLDARYAEPAAWFD